jgi:hypothetical protein
MDRAAKFATTAGALDKNVQWVPIKKTDGEKQIVYGEVYAPYILDTYGEFMTPEDIEVMAHRFMQLDLSKVIDTQHDNQPNGSFPSSRLSPVKATLITRRELGYWGFISLIRALDRSKKRIIERILISIPCQTYKCRCRD